MARSLENRPYSQSKIIESYGGGGGHPVVSDSGFTRPPRRGAGRSTWLGSGATQGVAPTIGPRADPWAFWFDLVRSVVVGVVTPMPPAAAALALRPAGCALAALAA